MFDQISGLQYFYLHPCVLHGAWLRGVTKCIRGIWSNITCLVVETVPICEITVSRALLHHTSVSSSSVSQVARFLSEEVKPVLQPYKSKMDVKIELELWETHAHNPCKLAKTTVLWLQPFIILLNKIVLMSSWCCFTAWCRSSNTVQSRNPYVLSSAF